MSVVFIHHFLKRTDNYTFLFVYYFRFYFFLILFHLSLFAARHHIPYNIWLSNKICEFEVVYIFKPVSHYLKIIPIRRLIGKVRLGSNKDVARYQEIKEMNDVTKLNGFYSVTEKLSPKRRHAQKCQPVVYCKESQISYLNFKEKF